MSYTKQYLAEVKQVVDLIDSTVIDRMVELLIAVRERDGRIFFIGSGGGAGHASHAVADFRKLAGFEAYAATDNVSELTAQINDNGWEASLANWLRESRLNFRDLIFCFSVGGGDAERNISGNLVRAMQYAQSVGASITGVVGRDGGYAAKAADVCLIIPTVNPALVTAHTEAFQATVWHLLVSHPNLRAAEMKWESVDNRTPVTQPGLVGQ